MSDNQTTPWWLQAGAETCHSCQHNFHYEAGYHCVYCDRPICPSCVRECHDSRETVCPQCIEVAEHKGGHGW